MTLGCIDRFCTARFDSRAEKERHQRFFHGIYDDVLANSQAEHSATTPEGSNSLQPVQEQLEEQVDKCLADLQNFSVYKLSAWEYERFVPPTVKQDIKDDINEMHKSRMAVLKRQVQQEVAQSGKAANLESIFNTFNDFWPGCGTLASEKGHLKRSMSFVEPVEVFLGRTAYEYKVNGEVHTGEHHNTCMMFPFAEQFEAVLSCKPLYDAMESFRAQRFSTDGKLRSCFDAMEWKRDPFFTAHVDAYTVLFYYDDVTVTNPIGQYKRKVQILPAPSANL
jgi:hypothetical protein